jgi:DNA-binding CsgD family transcriptional regulator/PAS domain-containing protein
MTTARIDAARLSHLIGLIYDAAIEPARWPIAMEAIRAELNFHNATLDLILLPSGHALSNVVCNVPPQYEAVMAAAGPDVVEQWGGAERLQSLPLDRPAILTKVNPAFDFATTTNPYAVAFARPQGISDVLSIGLARDARAIGSLSFGRHQSAGPISEREISIAHLLVPHLQRAATINRMLEGAAIAQDGFAATLETLTVPIALLDGNARILHANAAARHLLDRRSLIRETDGQIQAATRGASSALAVAIAEAARDESTLGRRGLGLPVVGESGASGALHVLPLGRRRADLGGGAVAALFVAEADTPFVAPTEMAAALFDFTPAEARVFGHLVSGHKPSAIAAMLGIEQSTVKTHLNRLYDKVGVRRQVDLVRTAASLAIPAKLEGGARHSS